MNQSVHTNVFSSPATSISVCEWSSLIAKEAISESGSLASHISTAFARRVNSPLAEWVNMYIAPIVDI